jgi:signal transduction histidine kinase
MKRGSSQLGCHMNPVGTSRAPVSRSAFNGFIPRRGADMSTSETWEAGGHPYRADTHPTEAVTFLWHDLRQSVAVILASAAAAAEDPSHSPEARRWLGHISEEAQRISRICEHAVRAESAPPVLRSVDDVVFGVIDSIGVVVSTVIEFRASGEEIAVDGAAMERALVNIVDNACNAAGPDGRVRIEIAGVSHRGVVITVDDSGPGFVARSGARAGLGLDGARRVLTSLGGALRISKRGPLGGARAELQVPWHSSQPSSDGAV